MSHVLCAIGEVSGQRGEGRSGGAECVLKWEASHKEVGAKQPSGKSISGGEERAGVQVGMTRCLKMQELGVACQEWTGTGHQPERGRSRSRRTLGFCTKGKQGRASSRATSLGMCWGYMVGEMLEPSGAPWRVQVGPEESRLRDKELQILREP